MEEEACTLSTSVMIVEIVHFDLLNSSYFYQCHIEYLFFHLL